MTADPAWIADLFGDLGTITTRRMMGGLSVYANGRIFAVADREGTLYLKAKGAFAADLVGMGSRPFAYPRRDGSVARMGYMTLPDAALDDPALACDLARGALTQE